MPNIFQLRTMLELRTFYITSPKNSQKFYDEILMMLLLFKAFDG